VVLMLPLEGEPLIVGLIVNKPTRLPLIELFPKSPTLKKSSDDAYLGGPIDVSTAALVFHAPKAPKQAMQLYDDVYLSFDGKLISRLMQDPKQTGDVRLFLGRAQWDPEQLQGEALEGSWYSLRAEGEVIFDRDSEHLWKRLHERARPPASVENRTTQPTKVQYLAAPINVPSLRRASPTVVN
jgi:putative transcriptional regulator